MGVFRGWFPLSRKPAPAVILKMQKICPKSMETLKPQNILITTTITMSQRVLSFAANILHFFGIQRVLRRAKHIDRLHWSID